MIAPLRNSLFRAIQSQLADQPQSQSNEAVAAWLLRIMSIAVFDAGRIPDDPQRQFDDGVSGDVLLKLSREAISRAIDYSQINPRILGNIYERFLQYVNEIEGRRLDPQAGRDTRRKEGTFYTPQSVTRFLVEHTVDEALARRPGRKPWELVCLDPACGSGHFLVEYVNYVAARCEEMDDRRSCQQWKRYVTQHGVFGVDKDSTAVMLTKLSLWINSALQDEPFVTIDTHVKCGNSLVLPWKIEFAEVFEEQRGFDLVVGNPPWGADLTEIREYLDGGPFTLARGQYDSYELFIELGRRLLREGGMFGFIIPDSITLPEHEPLRRMLLDQTALTRLVRLGEGIFPSVFRAAFFLCFANQPPPPEQRVRVGTLRKAHRKQLEDDTLSGPLKAIAALVSDVGHERLQSDFARNPRADFDVLAADADRAIGGAIDARALHWPDLTSTGRGVELGKAGEVLQCPYCYRWDTLPAKSKGARREKKCKHCGRQFLMDTAANQAVIVSDRKRGDAWRPFLIGESVNRYQVSRRLWIDASRDGINYKEERFYQGKRLLVRKTGIGIMATIDDSAAYTNQVVFAWKMREDLESSLSRYRLEYLLGVLNSRLMMYRLSTLCGETEWRSFPYMTQKTIQQLPVRAIDFSQPREANLHDEIADRVAAVLATGRPPSTPDDYQIEILVMQLYGITRSMCRRIFDVLDEAQRLRVIREMSTREPDMLLEALPE